MDIRHCAQEQWCRMLIPNCGAEASSIASVACLASRAVRTLNTSGIRKSGVYASHRSRSSWRILASIARTDPRVLLCVTHPFSMVAKIQWVQIKAAPPEILHPSVLLRISGAYYPLAYSPRRRLTPQPLATFPSWGNAPPPGNRPTPSLSFTCNLPSTKPK